MSHMQVDLTRDKILKSILIFALPILVSNIFQQLYNTIDIMVVGNYLGDNSLAAIGACSSIYELLMNFAFGVGNGLSIVAARCYGKGDENLLKRSIAGSLVIWAALSAVLVIFSRFGLLPMLRLLKTPDNILAEAYSYISTITLFTAVMFGYNLCSGFLRAIGNSFMPLIFLIISSVGNILLDLLFITRLHMGIRGAAIATVLAQGFSVVLCLLYIFRYAKILIPSWKHFRTGKALTFELLTQGFSMGFMSAVVCSGTVILQRSINKLGEVYIACHTTARKMNSFFFLPCGTTAAATSTFVSQNRGAGHMDRIREGVWKACLITICWGVFATLFLAFFARPVASLFGSSDPVILDNASLYIRFSSFFYGVLGTLFTLRHTLQALGDRIRPIISSIIELVGKILFATFIVPLLGYWGVIICEPLIWCVMAAQLLYTYLHNTSVFPAGSYFRQRNLEKENRE